MPLVQKSDEAITTARQPPCVPREGRRVDRTDTQTTADTEPSTARPALTARHICVDAGFLSIALNVLEGALGATSFVNRLCLSHC